MRKASKLVVSLLVLFIAAIGVAMGSGPAFVHMTPCDSGSSTSAAFICSFTGTPGNLVFAHGTGYDGGGGTTFTSITNASTIDRTTTAGNPSAIFGWGAASNTSVTFNSTIAQHVVGQVDEFSGLVTSSPVDNHTGMAGETSSTTCAPGAITANASGELFLTWLSNDTDNASPGQGTLATSPVTTTTIEDSNGTFGIRSDVGYSIFSSTGSIAPTWTLSVAQEIACGDALIKIQTGPTISNLQEITRGFIYTWIATLWNWSGAAQTAWNGSLQEATQGDFSTFITNNGSCSSPSGKLLTYGTASSCAGSSTPMPHVLVALDCCGSDYGSDPVSAATAAPWANWGGGAPSGSSATAMKAVGMSSYEYIDASYVNDNNHSGYDWTQLNSSYTAAIAKQCGGSYLPSPGYISGQPTGSNYALTDPRQSTTQTFTNLITSYGYTNDPGTDFTALFFDDIGAWNGLGVLGNICGATDLGLFESWATIMANTVTSGHTPNIVANGLSEDVCGQYLVSGCHSTWSNPLAMLSPSNVIGGMAEFYMISPYDGDDAIPCNVNTDDACEWSVWQNLHLGTVNLGKLFWAYNRNSGDSTSQRIYDYASFMLLWSPTYSIYWTLFSTTGTTMHITPETGLVAYSPLVSSVPAFSSASPTTTGIAALKSGSVYVREYATCYYRSTEISNGSGGHGCAFIVNPTGSSQTIPALSQTYLHSVTVDSAMVGEGGTIHFTGPVPTSLTSKNATILVQQ